MIRPSDIHSLTDFTRNAKAYVEEIKRNRRPMAITVNGEAELIVMDVATYEANVDSTAETLAAIREGLADVENGRTRPADAVIGDMMRNLELRRTGVRKG